MKLGPGYCVLEIKLTLPEEYAAEATESIRAKAKEWNLAEPYITQTLADHRIFALAGESMSCRRSTAACPRVKLRGADHRALRVSF